MSMDMSFWKYKDGVEHNDAAVYETACCDGEMMDELESLPIDEILKKIADVFSDWSVQDDGKDFEKEGHGAFQIFTTPQIVRFDCYGLQESDANALMDVLIGFGCPLYDPQISIRFDEWTDR